jgi:hypothetical protein
LRRAALILILATVPALASVQAQAAGGDDLDPHSREGLQDTQHLLKTPSERDQYVNKDPHAKEVDAKVSALAGSSQNKEEIYDLASQVMETITAESKGDPAKMQQLLEEAQKNPKQFYDRYFSAEQKARLHGLAQKIDSPKKRPSTP